MKLLKTKWLLTLFIAGLLVPFFGCENANQQSDKSRTTKNETDSNSGSANLDKDESGSDASASDTKHTRSDTKGSAANAEETKAIPQGEIEYGDRLPEVLGVEYSFINGEDYRFDITLSSKYDSPERYADAWRVLDGNDKELGIRVLGHDHANEQPFTRSSNIKIPESTKTVFAEGRDQENGWSGQRFKVDLK